MDLEFPKDHPLYGRRILKLFSDEALLESYKYEDMVDAKFDLALFEELRAAKLEKDEQNLCLDSEQASEVKKPERKKPNSKEPTAKRAKVGKGKNVNESNAENEEATGEKRRSLTEEAKYHSLVRVFERRPEYTKAMELYAAAAAASAAAAKEAAVKWMALIEEEKKAMHLYNAATAENEDQEGYDKEDKEGQSDDKEAPAPGEVEELTDEE